MQSMQRQFGRLLSKGPGENAKVAVLLKDYEDADNVLAKIIDGARMWRDSWASLVSSQLQIVTEYEGLYDPIVGASDGHSRAAATPQLQLDRTFRLKKAYAELKTEIIEEMILIEENVMRPATDARDSIAPIRKTIKKRENKRLDYEKAQDRALKLQRKQGRTPKEDAALAKADAERSRAADEFEIADNHIRDTLPPVINAAFSLVAPLVSNLVMIQNRLLGLYYTTLHEYCSDCGFPSPPPPMEEVVAIWNAASGPVRSQIESISFIARGKAVHQRTGNGNGAPARPSPTPLNDARRNPSGLISGPSARALRAPALPQEDRTPSPPSAYKPPDYANATDFTTAAILGGAAVARTARDSPPAYADAVTSHLRPTNGLAAVGKKKPPPPPPKRAATAQPEEWVVAKFAFAGEGTGDLSFNEGDRIKILTKTETDQDWWVGELKGVRGSFPANYCKLLP